MLVSENVTTEIYKAFIHNAHSISVISNTGKVCNDPLISGDCQLFYNCTTCVQASGCSWCDGMCTSNKTCEVTSLNQCPYNHCLATDCAQCYQLSGCEWNDLKYPHCENGKQFDYNFIISIA